MVNKYDTVEAHIDFVRRSLKEISDDSYYTDEEIYKVLVDARAIVYERRIKKGKDLPSFMYQTICIPLCEDEFHDCDCVPEGYGCKILKTKYDLPHSFFNGHADLLRVSTLGGEEIAPTTEAKARYRKYKKTRRDNLYYIRINNKLAVFNSPFNRLRVITVRAVFYDPVEALQISMCDPDTKECQDITQIGFGTLASDNLDIYNLAIQTLTVSKQLPDDRSNNAESVPVQNQI